MIDDFAFPMADGVGPQYPTLGPQLSTVVQMAARTQTANMASPYPSLNLALPHFCLCKHHSLTCRGDLPQWRLLILTLVPGT
jgi:hypothetical protein